LHFSVVDVDVSSKPEVPPECYKSQLIVTLSNAENKDTEYIIHSNMFNSDVSIAGIDNPAFVVSFDLTVTFEIVNFTVTFIFGIVSFNLTFTFDIVCFAFRKCRIIYTRNAKLISIKKTMLI
jgi:hypothetical protein